MSKTNCINCGSAKDVTEIVCPFCGTKYTDLSTIELFSDKPLYIQMKGRNGNIVTAKAYITNTTLQYHPEVTSLFSMDGLVHKHISAINVSGTIDFSLYESKFPE